MSWIKEPIDPLTNGIRVLIVDNDLRIREQHTALLSLWGYIPVVAEGIGDALLKDAVNRAQRQRCHIALVDKRLRDDDDTRDWSGLKLVREFASPTLAIIVSGSGERKPAVEALTKYGAVAFVGKEDGPEALHDTIAEVIAKHALGVRIEQITWPYSVSSAKIVTELVGDDPIVPADEADEVISRLFTHSTHISLEPLSSGNLLWKSSDHIRRRSLVFRANIDHNPAPLVVKLARRHKIEEELTNYQAFVRDKLRAGFRPELRAHTLLWDIGGVAYTYTGLDDPSTSDWPKTFAAYYRATERSDQVVKPLISFFNSDNWGYWYDVDVSVAKRTLFEAYDQSWKGRFSKRISEWSKHAHWLAFPGLPLKLPNPMHWLTGHAHTSGHIVTAREAVTHGDLHGDNLFIDAQGNAWPIDFARTGRGPILRDFVEIIHDIVTRLAQIELANGQQFYNLVIALCQPLKPNQKMSLTTEIQQSPETLKAFEVAQELLQLTHTRTHYRDRRELLWGLLLNSLFVNSILSEDHPRYDKSLLLGSVICERLERWESDWPPPDWPAVIWQSKRKRSQGRAAVMTQAKGDTGGSIDQAVVSLDSQRAQAGSSEKRGAVEQTIEHQAESKGWVPSVPEHSINALGREDGIQPDQEHSAITTSDEIKHQRELLTINRRNLAQYLKQQALLGEAHAPPGVNNGILEARANIRRIKAILRSWGEEVADQSDDEPSSTQDSAVERPPSVPSAQKRQ